MNNKYGFLTPNPNETFDEFRQRAYRLKYAGDLRLNWYDIAEMFGELFGVFRDESVWRKEAKRLYIADIATQCDPDTNDSNGCVTNAPHLNTDTEAYRQYLEIRKERVKASDERIQTNAYIRQLAREETLKEIALEVAQEMSSKKLLNPPVAMPRMKSENEGILQISDWHYGIMVNNHWNRFSPEICRARVSALLAETIDFCEKFNVSTLHLVNLSDLICGRIHLQLRIESRIDVVTQTIEVSEILAEFINTLTENGIRVEYYDCLDNHSRVEPDKKSSLDLESVARFIPWYLKARLTDNPLVNINDNEYDDDIVTFTTKGYRIGGVHGHKDKPSRVVENLTLMMKENFDLILTAHLHHFSCDEQNEVTVVSNGSLMGTDDHSKDLRYTSKPSQNLILVSEKNVVDYIHRVVLD